MTEQLKQDIQEQLEFLPKESQEAINSFDWAKISEEIGKKYFLIGNDINVLQAQIGLVLVGLEGQDELAVEIEDEVGTSRENAQKISDEVVQKILKPIFENLSQKIKMSLKDRTVNWQQNLDFIMSGGDYTSFIQKRIETKDAERWVPKETSTFNPSKLDDLKSKFTI